MVVVKFSKWQKVWHARALARASWFGTRHSKWTLTVWVLMTQLRLSSWRVLLTTCYSWIAGSPRKAAWWSSSQEPVPLPSPMLKALSFRTLTYTGLLRYRCNRWLKIAISQIGSNSWTPARRLLEKFWSKLSSFRKKDQFKNPRHLPRRKYALTKET